MKYYSWVALGLTVFMIVLVAAEVSVHSIWMRENGVVESASSLFYLICLACLLWRGGMDWLRHYYYLAGLLLFFALRELDFDKRFTAVGILKSRFFGSDLVSLPEKIVGAVVVLMLLSCLFLTVARHWRSFFQQLKRGVTHTIGVAAALMLIIVSKTLDGIARKLADIQVTLSDRMIAVFQLLEETLELGIPLMLLVASCDYLNQKYNDEKSR